jgi:DNA replication protein DnaC
VSTSSELAHLFRAMKAPAAARALPKLADRARAEEWSYERFAEALLATEQSSREAHGGEGRIRAARFPARKTLFMLVSRRYERASLIVTSNKPFSAWGDSSATTRPPPR